MSDTKQGIDTAAIRDDCHHILRTSGDVGRRAWAMLCLSLIAALDTLTARLAAVERERDAARGVVDALREFRGECQVIGITQDDFPSRLMALFGSLTDYDAVTDAANEGATDGE